VIRIENKKTFKGEGVYVGRPSPLGNPFSHVPSTKAEFRVETRDEAVDCYEPWLRGKLKTDTLVKTAFWTLVDFYRVFGDLTLICWCVPKRCHAEIIAKLIEEAIDAGETCNEPPQQVQAVETQGSGEDVAEQDLAGEDSVETTQG
jgi:hypothetical protein